MRQPDLDLLIVARAIWQAEPQRDTSGAKAAFGRLLLKLFVLEQVQMLRRDRDGGFDAYPVATNK